MIDGSAAGISIVFKVWREDARRLRASSSRRGSTERRPTAVETATGKNTMSEQITILLSNPGPNHRMSSGARARIGVDWAATRYGDRTSPTIRERARAYPANNPMLAPKTNPRTTSWRVAATSGAIVPSVQAVTNRFATVSGPGRMYSG